MRFKKGEWEKAKQVILFDLDELKECEIKEEWEETFEQLKGNLKDLFGVKYCCASCQRYLEDEDLMNTFCLICKKEAK